MAREGLLLVERGRSLCRAGDRHLSYCRQFIKRPEWASILACCRDVPGRVGRDGKSTASEQNPRYHESHQPDDGPDCLSQLYRCSAQMQTFC